MFAFLKAKLQTKCNRRDKIVQRVRKKLVSEVRYMKIGAAISKRIRKIGENGRKVTFGPKTGENEGKSRVFRVFRAFPRF